MPLIFRDSQLVFSNNQLAMSSTCCCESEVIEVECNGFTIRLPAEAIVTFDLDDFIDRPFFEPPIGCREDDYCKEFAQSWVLPLRTVNTGAAIYEQRPLAPFCTDLNGLSPYASLRISPLCTTGMVEIRANAYLIGNVNAVSHHGFFSMPPLGNFVGLSGTLPLITQPPSQLCATARAASFSL